MSRQWVIAARPLGRPLLESDFRLEPATVAPPEAGQIGFRTLYLSFEPAQKSWMENIAAYAAETSLGEPMHGRGIAEVVESRSDKFRKGDLVVGPVTWREAGNADASEFTMIPQGLPLTAALSLVGSSARTAYLGLMMVGKPRTGDMLVVSGAAGAVGSMVGQIGKIAGCRVIGVAGGPEKCRVLTEELGFDGAIDYKNEKVRHRLRELCPDGIDVFFDNVGGEVLNDALARIAHHARVVICGGISRYNSDPRDPSQMPAGPRNYFNLVHRNATMGGFIVGDYADYWSEADKRLTQWAKGGQLKAREDIQHGFENAPRTLLRLFEGRNIGKQMLRVADPS